MQCYVAGIGLCGPGLQGWPAAAAVLRGEVAWTAVDNVLPPALALPPTERRRATQGTRLAVTVAKEAIDAAGQQASAVSSVFASSASNPDIIHEMCATLAAGQRDLSPIKFHNSVHNSPAGYFSIATKSQEASTSLCAFDASAAAALLEAALQIAFDDKPVVLVSCDLPYPGPLGSARTIEGVWGAALVLTQSAPQPGAALIELCYGPRRPQTALPEPALERARTTNPTARLLPLLWALARSEDAEINLDLGTEATLTVSVQCR